MELKQGDIKDNKRFIIIAIVILIGVWKYQVVLVGLEFVLHIIFPFILGGAVAFIINVPMSFFERHVFHNKQMKDSKISKKLGRPLSLLIAIGAVIGICMVVIFVVVPQLGATFVSLGMNIQEFIPKAQIWCEQLFQNNKEIVKWINNLEINWEQIAESLITFFKIGAGSVLDVSFAAAKSIISGMTTFFIGFIFACYIVLQKEKLYIQVEKVLYAFLPSKVVTNILGICSLSYKTFSSFLTGQCLEAIILGTLFLIVLTILQLPYALLIGILIAFTALIPIFGSFVGCFVGTFLILMVNPFQALIFLVIFLILQQVEGNLIYPHVVGNSVGLPSIWVLVAVSVGASLMGVVGMLVFIPLTSVCYTIFRAYVYERLRKKNIKL
ncbi:MAG: AI-2E family transporter [Lachnospiraceae bacterium]